MTVRYPDISAWEAGIPVTGAPAICVKVTEGTGWLSSDYAAALSRAVTAGVFSFGYHFLHAGDPAGQAAWCHGHAAGRPLMIDAEPTGTSRPGLGDITGFTDAYRNAGGTVRLVYLPRWYWQQLGSPGLGALASRGLSLVSSNYSAYSDGPDGAGWAPYGGLTPAIWQYTSSAAFNGQQVDFNAYRGSLAELRALVTGAESPVRERLPGSGKAPPFPYPGTDYLGQPSPDPHCHSGYYGGPDTASVHTWQARMAARGWTITQDGQYGPASDQVCRQFQAEKGLAVDGKAGPVTWTATWSAAVT